MENKNKHHEQPFAYFITFRTYGTWLHGDARTSVDREHNIFDTPRIKQDTLRYHHMEKNLKGEEFLLTIPQREIVLQAIIEVCQYSKWYLHSVHVRTNHVHIIVSTDQNPEYIMGKMKAYASRALNKNFPELKGRKFWTAHGSTRYIFSKNFLHPIMRYVILEQGENSICYYDKSFDNVYIVEE